MGLHKRNLHKDRYDIDRLKIRTPELLPYIKKNPQGESTIDFTNSTAVRYLNQALLAEHYGVDKWAIPNEYLCPPIPGRSDYIHHLADLLGHPDGEKVYQDKNIRALDIGSGANCIYPILGSQIYGWKFLASEVDVQAYKTASLIVTANPNLVNFIQVKKQPDRNFIFKHVIQSKHKFDCSLCNPPFHKSVSHAKESNDRKVRNLSKGKAGAGTSPLNFGGQNTELWYPGGEVAFLNKMVHESARYENQVRWFTSLVSRKENLRPLVSLVKRKGVKDYKIIEMSQGQKKSRILAWTFLTKKQHTDW